MNKQEQNNMVIARQSTLTQITGEIRTELVRKSIHILVAFTPSLAGLVGLIPTMALLGSGLLVYAISEALRLNGISVPVIGTVTRMAMRSRDKSGFVLGPVTLGLGALLALMMYPEPASAMAIYALALGDGFASLAGKVFGTVRIPRTGGKSLEGSLACFVAVLFAASLVFPGAGLHQLFIIAAVATVLEMLPTKDLDNIIMPIGTGLVAYMMFL